jgi:hypothetical protein
MHYRWSLSLVLLFAACGDDSGAGTEGVEQDASSDSAAMADSPAMHGDGMSMHDAPVLDGEAAPEPTAEGSAAYVVESYACAHGGGGGGGGGGPMPADAQADIQFLLANHDLVSRHVTYLETGIESVTTSDNADVAATLQRHVAAMFQRVYVDEGSVRPWDPLFAAAIAEHARTALTIENIDGGVYATHTGVDPGAVALVHGHAQTVSLFVEGGEAEAQNCHSVPE